MRHRTNRRKFKSFFLPVILIYSALFLAYATALISFSMANIKSNTINNKRITALSIAEAGVNYYLWHLEHYPEDFCDTFYDASGTVTSTHSCNDVSEDIISDHPDLAGFKGPFEHEYSDGNKVIGTYKLYIKGPSGAKGNPIVVSEGQLKGGGPIKKIVVEVGTKSLAKYSVITDGYSTAETKSTINSSVSLTSKADWETAGSQGVDADTATAPGDIKIDMTEREIDNYTIDKFGSIAGEVANISDDDLGTGIIMDQGASNKIVWNFDREYYLSKLQTYFADTFSPNYVEMQFCLYPATGGFFKCNFIGYPDHLNLSVLGNGNKNTGEWTSFNWPGTDASNLPQKRSQVVIWTGEHELYQADLREVKAFHRPLSATHISSFTQIDGTTNLKSWNTFRARERDSNQPSSASLRISDTKIEYQFRSGDGSTNESAWSAWTDKVDYDGTAISLSAVPADMSHRYLQVKTTFTTTSPSNNPVLSDYTISFSQEIKSYTDKWNVLTMPSNYSLFGSVHSNGPIHFDSTLDPKYVVQSAYPLSSILIGDHSGGPDPVYASYCDEVLNPNEVYECPPIWGEGTTEDNVKYPVTNVDLSSVINNQYFDKLKSKAIEDEDEDPANKNGFYYDMLDQPGQCGTNSHIGVYFDSDRITFHWITSQITTEGISARGDPCFSISMDDIDKSKYKIIYFDNTGDNVMHLGGRDIVILGGKWNGNVTLVSNTSMFIRSMNLKYTKEGASIGFTARTNFISGAYENTNANWSDAFDSSLCPQSDPAKSVTFCSYQPAITDYTPNSSLVLSQEWDATFISTNKWATIDSLDNYGAFKLYGSIINLEGNIPINNWSSATITPNLGVAPPNFPYLKDVSIVSWREE